MLLYSFYDVLESSINCQDSAFCSPFYNIATKTPAMFEQRNACIVIPIYKDLDLWEQEALANNLKILHNHHAAFIYPEGYDISRLHGEYPQVELLAVSDEWLGKNLGIDGYNSMMLSEEFYGMFASYRYILICHTDA